eukprot:13576375-Alexandrium_andersonii.AAC.1
MLGSAGAAGRLGSAGAPPPRGPSRSPTRRSRTPARASATPEKSPQQGGARPPGARPRRASSTARARPPCLSFAIRAAVGMRVGVVHLAALALGRACLLYTSPSPRD